MSRAGPGGGGGGYAQQDAEEVWVRIINALQNSLPGLPAPSSSSSSSQEASAAAATSASRKFVQQYMTGEMTVKRYTKEAPEEEATISKDSFTMLQCNIGMSTNDMLAGISDSLTQQIEKTSATLGRTAVYEEESRVSRLPAYLATHFVRFYWRRDINKKTKIMRKVKFPFDLDATPFCAEELKEKLKATRAKIIEIDKARDERTKIRRRVKAKRESDDKAAKEAGAAGADAGGAAMAVDSTPAAAASAAASEGGAKEDSSAGAGGSSSGSGPELGAALTEEEELALRAKERAAVQASIHPDLLADVGANSSALYELVGIVTHKGAAADAGHYISWVKCAAADDDPSVLANIPGAAEAAAGAAAGAEKKKPSLAEMDKAKTEEWYKVSTAREPKILGTLLARQRVPILAHIRPPPRARSSTTTRSPPCRGTRSRCSTAAERTRSHTSVSQAALLTASDVDCCWREEMLCYNLLVY